MPDFYGTLSPEELDRVRKWLSVNWHTPRCPVSGHNEWELNDTMVQLPAYSGGRPLLAAAPTFPLILITCSYCGYTFFLSAVKVGILTPPSPLPRSNVPVPPRTPDV